MEHHESCEPHDEASKYCRESGKANPWMVSTLILGGIIVGFGLAQIPGLNFEVGSKKTSVTAIPPSAPSAVRGEPEAPVLTAEQIAALPDDDPVIGDAKASVTIVEFSDFQCPYCARFFRDAFSSIEENYIKTGKVKLVYRDFPLDFHPQAAPAALAAECADDQGKFKEMHDELFVTQQEWAGKPEAVTMFKGYAKKLGLKSGEFDSCLDSKKYDLEIRKDLIDGAAVGVSGTPGFFVNGKQLSGAMPYDLVFKPVLDAALAGKNWEIEYDAVGRIKGVKVE